MSYIQVNPYLTIAELKEELKMAETDTAYDDALGAAIVNASRWVDNYLQRDFFYHDHRIVPLVLDETSRVYGGRIFLPYRPVLALDQLTLEGTTLTADEYYPRGDLYGEGDGEIWSTFGDWKLSRPDRLLTIKGEFGFRQASTYPVTEAGDDTNQLSNWSLRDLGSSAVLYWGIESESPTTCRVSLWSDSAHSNRIATGTGLNASTVTLVADNGSGVSGTVLAAYTGNDLDVGNTLTPGTPAVDRSQVPAGIPGHVRLAARLVAAALSGHNRKEVAGLDGDKTSILTNSIPKTVYDMLGRQCPILV